MDTNFTANALRILTDMYRSQSLQCGTLIAKSSTTTLSSNELKKDLHSVCDMNVLHITLVTDTLALVEFDKPIHDLDAYRKKVDERKRNTDTICLELLGSAKGILVTGDINSVISEECLALYFENTRSGGIEGTVKSVKKDDIGSHFYAQVYIDNENAMKSILSKDHVIESKPLVVGPLYPLMHLEAIENLKKLTEAESSCIPIPVRMKGDNERSNTSCRLSWTEINGTEGNNGDSDKDRKQVKTFYNEELPKTHCNVERKCNSSTDELTTVTITKLTSSKVTMLIIASFAKKNESKDVSVTLKEKEGEVVIKTISDKSNKEVKLRMYVELDKVCEAGLTLPMEMCKFYGRPECKNCLRWRSKENRLRVAYEIGNNLLTCLGFSKTDVDKGLTFAKSTVTTLCIKLRLGQEKFTDGAEWGRFNGSIDSDLTTVFMQPDHASKELVIMSFNKDKAYDIQKKIIQYLKHSAPQQTFRCVLSGAKAECFRKNFEDELRNDVRKRDTKLDVVTDNENPLQLTITIHGDEEAKKMVNYHISRIWHESIDFKKLLIEDDCVIQLNKGLISKHGDPFFRQFEKKKSCFIEVTHGSKSSPLAAAPLQVKNQMEGKRTDDPVKASTENHHNVPRRLSRNMSETAQMFHASVSVVKGDIVKQRVHALVNVIPPSQKLNDGVISKAFVQAGVQTLIQMFEQVTASRKSKSIICTASSGTLPSKIVIHVTLQQWPNSYDEVVFSTMHAIYTECTKANCVTVAIPPLGVGRLYNYRAADVSYSMLNATYTWLQQNVDKLKEISFVIYEDELFEKFVDDLKMFMESKVQHVSDKQIRDNTNDAKRNLSSAQMSPITVTVFAESKDRCTELRNELGRTMKKNFLHEEHIPEKSNISEAARKEIKEALSRHNVRSVKGTDGYILKGYKKDVKEAQKEILMMLFDEKDEHVARRERKINTKRGTCEFVKGMVQDLPKVPPYWKYFRPGERINTTIANVEHFFLKKEHQKVPLHKESDCYKTILRMINQTFDASKLGMGKDALGLDKLRYTKLYVLKIERIENLELYRIYADKRISSFCKLQKLRKCEFKPISHLPGSSGAMLLDQYMNATLVQDLYNEINECYLFHGTSEDTVDSICNQGLDPRMSGPKAMFGAGVYGAESVMKADQYTDGKANRTAGQGSPKKMFLIRMILGDCYICTDQDPHKYRRPPCIECYRDHCKDHSGLFDSVIGDNKRLFREFVVYNGNQCYPEYLITYERR